MSAGRPTKYTSELADEICARLSEGRSMNSVCSDDDMPDKSNVFRWLVKYVEFRDKYHDANDVRSDALKESMIDVSLEPLIGKTTTIKETKDGTFVEERQSDNVERSKLIVNTLQWQLARMSPKKYGDRIGEVPQINGDVTLNLTQQILEVLSVDQLEKIKQHAIIAPPDNAG